jgi:hypothetical protein
MADMDPDVERLARVIANSEPYGSDGSGWADTLVVPANIEPYITRHGHKVFGDYQRPMWTLYTDGAYAIIAELKERPLGWRPEAPAPEGEKAPGSGGESPDADEPEIPVAPWRIARGLD